MSSLIVVGTEGVGKTPLAKALANHYAKPYFKFQNEVQALKSTEHPGQHMLWFDYGLTQLMFQTGLSIVSDRGFPCEYVYSSYFKRKTDEHLLAQIEENHAALGTVIVHVRDSKIAEHAKEDEHVHRDHIPKIQALYDIILATTICKKVTYDVSTSALCERDEDRMAIDLPNLIELIDREVLK